ncbi:sugar transferase [Planococcus lenghuensis]|uniref:UDP-phosphate N-acetylgalactosaminyl-1-phosphate transferase n=1 Tax=Planococcus lenghuensis TaxID=2213202 RepID=A0A1Q2L1E1_9BACL|nr:sugar transferase [Planococcus lenghuensis]AQQ54226.1 UDP-phosphate N-acetylgalactosaminyl-1-phosphate transferase [Planococcus lenghuensis]
MKLRNEDYWENQNFRERERVIYFGNMNRSYEVMKYAIERTLIFIGLPLILLIILIAGIAIKLESKGSVFYSQQRLGMQGQVFTIYKLRSMVSDAEKEGAKWAEKDDCRVTEVGKFIRKTRIDELPQLLNILKGDMSLIGPRPERPELTEEFRRELPDFVERLRVRPGITGLAQINGGYDLSPEQKLMYDLFYIRNQNLFFDLKILYKTWKIIFTGSGAR